MEFPLDRFALLSHKHYLRFGCVMVVPGVAAEFLAEVALILAGGFSLAHVLLVLVELVFDTDSIAVEALLHTFVLLVATVLHCLRVVEHLLAFLLALLVIAACLQALVVSKLTEVCSCMPCFIAAGFIGTFPLA